MNEYSSTECGWLSSHSLLIHSMSAPQMSQSELYRSRNCLQSFVYGKSRARYSGHINSRLMRVWAQPDQTSHNSYYMRGKQKEHSSSTCWKTCYDLFESLLVPLIIHIEVERTTCATKFNVSVKYTSTMGWLASLGPSYRCTCLPGYTDLG
jgi:hypothetical protein